MKDYGESSGQLAETEKELENLDADFKAVKKTFMKYYGELSWKNDSKEKASQNCVSENRIRFHLVYDSRARNSSKFPILKRPSSLRLAVLTTSTSVVPPSNS